MGDLARAVAERAAQTGFSGVVRVDRAGEVELCAAFGRADRAHAVAVTPATRFGLASGAKGFTALVVMSLVEQGVLRLRTRARDLLGADLPLVADDVTVEHLLAHRSGIGDYLDEHAQTVLDHVLTVPVHTLDSTAAYLPVLDGHPTRFAAGTRFAYCNAGFVLLALLAERAAGTPFPELVRTLVCEPAGLVGTAFLRGDELPGDVARGYLHADGLRTNVLHLPVLGSGDGGIHSTVADVATLWSALHSETIVPAARLAEMTRPRSDWPEEQRRYGLGLHLDATTDAVFLEGYDAGVSFRSVHRPSTGLTWTVVSNWTDGAWPIVRLLSDRLES